MPEGPGLSPANIAARSTPVGRDEALDKLHEQLKGAIDRGTTHVAESVKDLLNDAAARAAAALPGSSSRTGINRGASFAAVPRPDSEGFSMKKRWQLNSLPSLALSSRL